MKRAISPQSIRFLPSPTAFSSPPTRKMNLAKPQRKTTRARASKTGRAARIKFRNTSTNSLKLVGAILRWANRTAKLINGGANQISQNP